MTALKRAFLKTSLVIWACYNFACSKALNLNATGETIDELSSKISEESVWRQFIASPRPLPSSTAKIHFDIYVEWDRHTLTENSDEAPFFSLHAFFNGSIPSDGIEIRFRKVENDLTLTIWTDGRRAPLEAKLEKYFESRADLKIYLEIHNRPTEQSLSRVVIWTDYLDFQTGARLPRKVFTEAQAEFDSRHSSSSLGRGRGVLWGVELFRVRSFSVKRQTPWL